MSQEFDQAVIWTALPQGFVPGSEEKQAQVSVFVTPQLSVKSSNGTPPHLSTYTDWVNWPETMRSSPSGPVKFKLNITAVGANLTGGTPVSIAAEPDLTVLNPGYWAAMFPKGGTTTRVDPYEVENFNSVPIRSYHTGKVHSYVESLYGPINAAPSTPLNFAPIHEEELIRGLARPDLYRGGIGGGLEPGYPMPVETEGAQFAAYSNLIARPAQFYSAMQLHEVPAEERAKPPTEAPVIDFHEAVSSLSAYPELLQYFGLMFTLTFDVSVLADPEPPPYFLLEVEPEWTSEFGKKRSQDVRPRTVGVLSTFMAKPYGSDYNNESASDGAGFLLLGKKSGTEPQFSILDVDLDGACQSLTTTLAGIESTLGAHSQTGVAVDLRLPSLRSSGPSVLWHGWGSEDRSIQPGGSLNLAALAKLQTKFSEEVKAWIEAPEPNKPPLPVVYSEHLTRGWRLDVGTAARFVGDQAGLQISWDSLHWRLGRYRFGPDGAEELNENKPLEGFVSPAVTHQPVANKGDTPSRLWIHESIARWDGWSLSAPRPGAHIKDDGTISEPGEETNPVPKESHEDGHGNVNPTISANFFIPKAGTVISVPVPEQQEEEELGRTGLPPLRFGHFYFYRARSVDLSGWSVPQFAPSSPESPAVIGATHYRWEPVRPPFIVPTAALTVGEGALTIVIRDDGSGSPVKPNARWLFPPKVHELMAEEHGAFDNRAGESKGVPSVTAQELIKEYNDGSLSTIPGMVSEPGSAGVENLVRPYSPGQQVPTLPVTWLPDPPAVGLAISGTGAPPHPVAPGYQPLPSAKPPFVDLWSGAWPALQAKLLMVRAATPPYEGFDSVDEKDATDHWPWLANPIWSFPEAQAGSAKLLEMRVVPGSVYRLQLSSAFAATENPEELGALGSFGLWPWIEKATLQSHPGAGPPLAPPSPVVARADARAGLQYQLTPAETLTVVYAVLIPQRQPEFSPSRRTSRQPNATSVTIEDPHYLVDPPSTGTVTLEATWTDPVDNPAAPEDWTYDPAEPEDNGKLPRAFAQEPRTFSQAGLLMHVDNLYPTVVPPDLVTVSPPAGEESPFGFIGFEGGFDELGPKLYAEQHIGDTKHHLVTYTATAASRFGEFFASTVTVTLGTAPTTIDARGISPSNLRVVVPEVPSSSAPHGVALAATTVPASLYEVDAAGGTITLKAGATVKQPPVGSPSGTAETVELEKTEVAVTFVPKDTRTGTPQQVHVLSSAAPPPIKVVKVAPAWSLSRQGSVHEAAGYRYARKGNTLRVYFERPWYATGADELLGVVVAHNAPGPALPTEVRADLVTTLGLDPISVTNVSGQISQSQLKFVTNINVPATETSPERTHATVTLVEETGSNLYDVYPYKPQYDPESGLWFADITLANAPEAGKPLLPPGYFLRLALVRYQPFTELASEPPVSAVSPVALVTFAQPVADRTVEVRGTGTINVTVRGPGYNGWRPPIVYDRDNPDAQHPNSNHEGTQTTSTMVVEIQEQSDENGFSGDLGWSTIEGHTRTLTADFAGPKPSESPNEVEWTTYTGITLPVSSKPLRLRISELDYFGTGPAPATIDTSLRRPFVCLIPLPS